MNHVAVLELDIGDKTADPRANLDLFDRLETAGEFIPVGDSTLDRLRDRHRRRRPPQPAAPAFRCSRTKATASNNGQ